jgi:hypothetical protein
MSTTPPTDIIALTITLNRREFEMAIGHGIELLHLLGYSGLVRPNMRWPLSVEIARDVAILGVQEIISDMAHRRRHEDIDDDEIPF